MSTTVTIFGNVTRDPELRYGQGNGKAWATFSVASSRSKKKGDGYEEIVSFYDVTCFGDMAEHAAQSLVKGQRVIVSGILDMEEYEKDGVKRKSAKITADEVGPSLRFGITAFQRAQKEGF
jgi:single-strand DNA-binding protein